MGQTARKRIAILGSTGSVGVQALDLVARFPDRFEVVALAAGRNSELLARQTIAHRPALVAIQDESRRDDLQQAARAAGARLLAGADGVDEVAVHPAADIVLSAIVGAAGLRPTQHALRAGRTVALANKESLVMAGALMRRTAEEAGAELIPVDSEHSALHQCLRGESIDEVRRLILTASGGPFRTTPLEQLKSVTPEQALKHPVWTMGRKISIDSATLMNKGLEVIEAHWLFGLPPERIDVVLHPQSYVHSMVEMIDGAIICQMGAPDMRGPIQYALGYPRRFAGPVPPLDIGAEGSLEFAPVDRTRFPGLDLAYAALAAGGTAPAVLNGANEVAVQAFLDGRIGYLGIPRLVQEVLEGHRPGRAESIEDVMQ
ncbi:MAG TPA: 1-deoxy-D-xylulose-5-phosphate reductoisomerase, partial [Candidatus Polarisedimenticolia bacterium]|nr:1-deoxy-D-xylulose-5-phosphate reductoisomerase [Candidatus Polarisedimenticolia bacterium]